jgi:hypothetical protein
MKYRRSKASRGSFFFTEVSFDSRNIFTDEQTVELLRWALKSSGDCASTNSLVEVPVEKRLGWSWGWSEYWVSDLLGFGACLKYLQPAQPCPETQPTGYSEKHSL